MRSAIVLLTLVLPAAAFGQAPDTLSFQGRLTDLAGVPLDTTGLNVTFRLYKAGVIVWSETQSIDVVDGVFNVHLGADTPLDTVAFNSPMELGIKIDKLAEMTPRTHLTSAAFALGVRGFYAYPESDSGITGMNVVAGASNNRIIPGVAAATIGGGGGTPGDGSGLSNIVYGNRGTISGGQENHAGPSAFVGGGYKNYATGSGSVIAGGSETQATQNFSTVGGGQSSSATASYATVGGGSSGSASGDFATVGGGDHNTASGENATVGGGENNIASGDNATVAGGSENHATQGRASIGGGYGNKVTGSYATIGGGLSNEAILNGGTIAGGQANVTNGSYATVGGGISNQALAHYATVPGGNRNIARGKFSFAAGNNARPGHDGSFVWADGFSELAADSVTTTGPNQFIIRAVGGVGIGTNDPQEMLHVNADGPTGIFLGGNGVSGPHAIIFDDESAGNGVQLIWRASPNQLIIEGGSGGTDTNEPDRFIFDKDDNYFAFDGATRPMIDNTYLLGTSAFKWAAVWAFNGTINTSDARLKQGITDLNHGLSAVEALRPVRYHWRDKPELGPRLGLLAQEVEKIVPEVIEHPDTEDGYLGMRYSELVPVLIKAIQEQQDVIEALTDRVARLEGGGGSH